MSAGFGVLVLASLMGLEVLLRAQRAMRAGAK